MRKTFSLLITLALMLSLVMVLQTSTPVLAATIPTVSTQTATSVETTSAIGRGTISDVGGENCYARGFEWGTSPGTYTGGQVLESGSFTPGIYSLSMGGLPSGTTIYYRAKAANSAGWGYGTQQSFLTKPAGPANVQATDGTITDYVLVTWDSSWGANFYYVFRNNSQIATVTALSFQDYTAGAPTNTGGTAQASDGAYVDRVNLNLNGAVAYPGATYSYEVTAVNGAGQSVVPVIIDTGYRGVNGPVTYQWQRSAGDSDGSYSDISGATGVSYDDTAAPADGSGRYYRCRITRSWANPPQVYSSPDRGYRAVSVSVTTSTGSGTASFISNAGTITGLTAVSPPSGAPAALPHGLFSFTITGLSSGQTVTITATMPDPVPTGTKWWKYQSGSWYPLDIGSDDGDDTITFTLTDGVFPGDEDGTPGQITDDGGPGEGEAVGWDTYPVNKVRVLLPWIILLAAVIGGASLLVLRRRRTQS